jgi:hypothetical protein
MQRFVGSQNITNFADKLESEVDPAKRATLRRLLVEEEDRLGHDQEQLELTNKRLASGRGLIAKQQSLIVSGALPPPSEVRQRRA